MAVLVFVAFCRCLIIAVYYVFNNRASNAYLPRVLRGGFSLVFRNGSCSALILETVLEYEITPATIERFCPEPGQWCDVIKADVQKLGQAYWESGVRVKCQSKSKDNPQGHRPYPRENAHTNDPTHVGLLWHFTLTPLFYFVSNTAVPQGTVGMPAHSTPFYAIPDPPAN